MRSLSSLAWLLVPVLAGSVVAGDGSGLRLDLPGEPEPAPADGGADLPVSHGTRFYFRISGWYTTLDAELAYGESVNTDVVDLDFERTLGYDTDLLTLRGEFGFTIGERMHLDFAANGPFNYDGDTTQSISFGDFSYGATAHTELDFVTFEADFSYDVIHEDKFRLGLGAGLRGVFMHFEVDGQATDSNGNPVGSRSEDLDAGAALPVIGLGARWDLSRHFYLAAKGMGIYAGNYGNAFDASAEVGWDFTRNFGVFAGYKYQHFEVDDIGADDFDLTFDESLYGPYAGVAVRF
jgi:hypothetical protein